MTADSKNAKDFLVKIIEFPVDSYSDYDDDYLNAKDFLVKTLGDEHEAWNHIDGPDTGTGVDFWFQHADGRVAYINYDQCIYTLNFMDGED